MTVEKQLPTNRVFYALDKLLLLAALVLVGLAVAEAWQGCWLTAVFELAIAANALLAEILLVAYRILLRWRGLARLVMELPAQSAAETAKLLRQL